MYLGNLSHKELIKTIKDECIPPLLSRFHKGQAGGRVCIIGGCEDYTGAPYFSANAAALMGCDLTHVICEQSAATVIKSYSPNLMVHPYLLDTNTFNRYSATGHDKETRNNDMKNNNFNKIKTLLRNIHVIVIGPGLGRDELILNTTKEIIKYILEELNGKIPIILDADGLFLLGKDKEVQDLLMKFPKGRIILTPNVVEFKRLYGSVIGNGKDHQEGNELQGLEIAKRLKCIVVEKGYQDRIFGCNGNMLVNEQIGSFKRVGGQGDTLTGTIATLLAFSRAMYDFNIMNDTNNNIEDKTSELEWIDYAMLSCYGGCCVTRECSRLAFEAKRRAMQTTDLNDRVGEVYDNIFG